MKYRMNFRRSCAAFVALSSGSILSFLAANLAGLGLGSGRGSLAYAAEVPQQSDHDKGVQPATPRIAVIGGGIGGTSAAYFLRKLLGPSASIDLYEPGLIGGRIATVNINGQDYECGGTIIHPKNQYMVNFREEFGFKKRENPSGIMGFYNGEKFVFTESKWAIITMLKLLWRYKLDCLYITSHVNTMLKAFSRIYKLQDEGHSFADPAQMLHAMGGQEFVDWTRKPLREVLKGQGYSDRFINEVASVAMRDNYGQSVNMTAFAGMVSLAGVQPGLWAVQGGNKQIPEALLKSSEAVWHHAKVGSIRNISKGTDTKFEVNAVTVDTNQESTREYDMVVVATPLTPGVGDRIQFQGFTSPIGPFSGRYQRTVATLIHGRPNTAAFGKKPGELLPNVETTRNISLDIRTLARNFPVDGTKEQKDGDPSTDAVYKIFSGDLLTKAQLDALFVSHDTTVATDWLAYPHYTANDQMPPFILSEGVFYINGIEWAASAMEMSVIGARNVALLAKEHWQGTSPAASKDEKQVKAEL